MLKIGTASIRRHVKEGLLQRIVAANFSLIPLYEVAHQIGITLSKSMRIAERRGIMIHIVWIERDTSVDHERLHNTEQCGGTKCILSRNCRGP